MVTRSAPGDKEWRFNLAGGFGFAPEYVGSDDYKINFLPLIDVEWRGAYFLSTQRGLGLNYVRSRQTRFGPRMTWAAGRKSSGSTDLTGMADLDPSYELGVFFEHFEGSWRFDGDIRYGLNDAGHNGVVASGGIALAGRLSDRSSLVIGGKFHWASTKYMLANFGVTSSEAVSGRAAYTPTSGMRDFGGYASIVHNVTDQIYLTIDGRADLLMSQPANSPIVTADQQFFFGTMLGFRF